MTELEFFKELFPPTDEYLNVHSFISHDGELLDYPEEMEDTPRIKEEGPVCECVGENTNKALFLYFQKIIKQGVQLPVYVNLDNQIMDGWHRLHAYYYMGEHKVPIYRNKLWRNHGFCWKNGLDGKRRLRLKTW